MAHLWFLDPQRVWTALELEACAYDLDRDPPAPRKPLRRLHRGSSSARRVILVPAGDPSDGRWALLVGPARRASVNGEAVDLGLRILDDRDLLQLDDFRRLYFSAEAVAEVRPRAGGERDAPCPRCRAPIVEGAPAVRCPACGVWHHQSEERPCWTYAEICAVCGQGTRSQDARYRWVPEAR